MQAFQLADYRQPLDGQGDHVAAIRRFLNSAPPGKWTLNLPGGSCDLFPEAAVEAHFCVSNNDAGLKRAAFWLRGLQDICIDGQHSSLRVRGEPLAAASRITHHAFMTTFILEDCTNVTIKDLSIDWASRHMAQAKVLASHGNSMEVEVVSDMRWWVWNGQIYFEGEGFCKPLQRIIAVEAATGAPVRGSGDNCGGDYEVVWHVEKLDERRIRITGPCKAIPQPGQWVILWLTGYDTGERLAHAIVISRCRDVILDNIRIHHAPAMAIVGQLSENITLRHCQVTPPPNSGLLFSASADATHFVQCTGQLLLEDCLFENQLDDAANVHGYYCQIVRPLGAKTLRARLGHPQHKGIFPCEPGETVEFIRAQDMVVRGTATVVALQSLNSETFDIEFREDLPDHLNTGDCFENITRQADLTIRSCVIRHNRARGILFSTRGRVLVEKCQFATPGAAILIAGDANGWFESGRVRDVTIRENTFTDCAHTPSWGRAAICIIPEIGEPLQPQAYYHAGIRIESNKFVDCSAPLVEARSVSRLKFSRNEIGSLKALAVVKTEHCERVTVE